MTTNFWNFVRTVKNVEKSTLHASVQNRSSSAVTTRPCKVFFQYEQNTILY
jgi:hypothetical protein